MQVPILSWHVLKAKPGKCKVTREIRACLAGRRGASLIRGRLSLQRGEISQNYVPLYTAFKVSRKQRGARGGAQNPTRGSTSPQRHDMGARSPAGAPQDKASPLLRRDKGRLCLTGKLPR